MEEKEKKRKKMFYGPNNDGTLAMKRGRFTNTALLVVLSAGSSMFTLCRPL